MIGNGHTARRDGPLRPRTGVRAFTLIELLTVLTIMVIIMGIGLASFQALTSGSGVDAAVRIVASRLRLARQYAITKRAKIAVIMPGPYATAIDASKRYACLRLAVVTGSGNTYAFSKWVENTSWMFLPPTASIMEADEDKGISNGAWPANAQLDPAENNYTQVNNVDLTKLGGGAADDNIRCVVFSPNGKVAGYSDEVTIGEATLRGAVWIVRNPDTDAGTANKSCMNQYNISIDLYTGRPYTETPDEY